MFETRAFYFVASLSLRPVCVCLSQSIQKTHFKIQEVHLLVFRKPVCFCLHATPKSHTQKQHLRPRYRNNAVVYPNQNMSREHTERLVGLFVVCLYSNIYFTHSLVAALCVVHSWPSEWLWWWRCCLFSFNFSTPASVVYNKTRLWKHSPVLTYTDKFKYQQGNMTERPLKAVCQCSCKQ